MEYIRPQDLKGSPWVLDEEDGLKLLKAAYNQGINTWDTADTYSNGESEVIIGKALKKFNIPRQKVIILSKIFNPVMDDGTRPASINDGPLVNQIGLSRKHIFHAIDKCLKRLGTDYIDVLQIHRLDRETPPEEIMRALHNVVQSGKTPFISMQPFYNLLYREEEQEMLPFCEATGVSVIPWSPIARGLLAKPLSSKNDEANQSIRSQSDKKTETWFADANLEIVNRVKKIANDKGISMALVATAWVLQKGCYPILGLNSEKRIKESVEALNVKFTKEELEYLESEYRPRNIQGM
ncbi:hypothetical protein H9Q71_007308 [Fusarium xylarioides]|nr:hypothetical protein H9Q71_007308 [Fusarium xylarioides]